MEVGEVAVDPEKLDRDVLGRAVDKSIVEVGIFLEVKEIFGCANPKNPHCTVGGIQVIETSKTLLVNKNLHTLTETEQVGAMGRGSSHSNFGTQLERSEHLVWKNYSNFQKSRCEKLNGGGLENRQQ